MKRWILRHFFELLLGFVCLSQWLTVWWLLAGGAQLPAWIHVAAVALLYAFNNMLVRGRWRFGRRPPPSSLGMRLYVGWAFASIFAGLFLLLAAFVYGAWNGIGAALAAQSAVPISIPAAPGDWFRWITYVGCGAIGLAFVYGYTIGQRRVRVTHHDIPVEDLPPALEGFRIAQISDVHMGQNLEPDELARYVARVNALEPDVICATGDLIDSPRADMDLFLPIFAGLRARHGVYAILGNHDHASGADRVANAIRKRTAITLLRDEHHPVLVGGAELHLIGLDDRGPDWARGFRHDPKLDELFAQVPPRSAVVLLNHRPDIFNHASALGIALTLSGHTHGGQIAIPWRGGRTLNPSQFITPFDRGLYERNATFLYTNCGLGVTSQRVRIGAPREISVFRLTARRR